jgi:hypothetical protein
VMPRFMIRRTRTVVALQPTVLYDLPVKYPPDCVFSEYDRPRARRRKNEPVLSAPVVCVYVADD